MRKKNQVILVLALAIAASGCINQESSEPVENTSVNSSSDVREITVTGGNYYFEPSNIDVEAGETVRFVFENAGGTHDMRIPEFNAGTNVISGGESESFTVTFEEEGSYEFLCSVGNHAEQGMTGTIQVS